MFFYSKEFFEENFKGITPPKVLYHYTSIETLALILKHQNVRFNRADRVNDPVEAESSSLGSFKKGTFLSCWTISEEDTIPMWNMYSNNMKGVRIQMPANMFLGREMIEYWGDGGFAIGYKNGITLTRNKPGVNALVGIIEGPNPVYYTNDESILYPNLHFDVEWAEHQSFQTFGVALSKPKSWAYEQEWRFKILACGQQFHSIPIDAMRSMYNFEKQPCIEEYLDIKLDSQSFCEMKVLMGPRCTDAERTIVKCLLEAYAPKAEVLTSGILVSN